MGVQLTSPPVLHPFINPFQDSFIPHKGFSYKPVIMDFLVLSFIELNKIFEKCTLYIGMRVGIFRNYSYLFIYREGERRK